MSIQMNAEEQAYLDLISDVLENGWDKPNRTNTDTRSQTGATLRFSLSNDDVRVLPLLTSKQTSFRLVATELLWFLAGDTSVETLTKQKNHIWDANGSREFLDSRGFMFRDEGDLGPVYGWQWRHWNSPYVELKDRTTTYKPSGIDQIQRVIDNIRNDPWSRRHIVSAWNPEQLDQMSLPPCHTFFQFIVRPFANQTHPCGDARDDREMYEFNRQPFWLDCVLYQRSADLPLGVPFNIASYSLLTHMIAHHTGLQAGQLIHNMGDVHIYHNQFEGCQTQIARTPLEFPSLEFVNPPENINDWSMDNFRVVGYKNHGRIKFPFTT